MERTRLVLIISTSSGTTKQGVQLRVLAFQFLRQHRISRISTCTSRVAPRIANSPAEVVARTRGSRDPRCTTPRCVRAAINERRRCQLPRRLYRVPYQQLWGPLAVRRDLHEGGCHASARSLRVISGRRRRFLCLLIKRVRPGVGGAPWAFQPLSPKGYRGPLSRPNPVV